MTTTPEPGATVRIGSARKTWTVDRIMVEGVVLTSIVPTGPRKGYRQMRVVDAAEIRPA